MRVFWDENNGSFDFLTICMLFSNRLNSQCCQLWQFHWKMRKPYLLDWTFLVITDESNTILSNIKQTECVHLLVIKLEHYFLLQMNGNRRSNLIGPLLDLLNYSSNRLEHHFLKIERYRTSTILPKKWLHKFSHKTGPFGKPFQHRSELLFLLLLLVSLKRVLSYTTFLI